MSRHHPTIGLRGKHIVTLRKTLGEISQASFAELLGVGIQIVRLWEQDRIACRGPAAIMIMLLVEKKLTEPVLRTLALQMKPKAVPRDDPDEDDDPEPADDDTKMYF